MRSAFTLVVTLFTMAATVPAFGDPEVEPVPWSPKVHVRVEKQETGSGGEQGKRPIGSSGKPRLKYHCFPDRTEPGTRCALRDFAGNEPAENAELTEGDVLRAVREIGLPSLRVQIQPGEETLVNIDTLFYEVPYRT